MEEDQMRNAEAIILEDAGFLRFDTGYSSINIIQYQSPDLLWVINIWRMRNGDTVDINLLGNSYSVSSRCSPAEFIPHLFKTFWKWKRIR